MAISTNGLNTVEISLHPLTQKIETELTSQRLWFLYIELEEWMNRWPQMRKIYAWTEKKIQSL